MKIPYIFNRFSFNFLVISWILANSMLWIACGVILLIVFIASHLGPFNETNGLSMLGASIAGTLIMLILKLTRFVVPCLILLEIFPKFRIKNQKFLKIYNNKFIQILTIIIAITQLICGVFMQTILLAYL